MLNQYIDREDSNSPTQRKDKFLSGNLLLKNITRENWVYFRKNVVEVDTSPFVSTGEPTKKHEFYDVSHV